MLPTVIRKVYKKFVKIRKVYNSLFVFFYELIEKYKD